MLSHYSICCIFDVSANESNYAAALAHDSLVLSEENCLTVAYDQFHN